MAENSERKSKNDRQSLNDGEKKDQGHKSNTSKHKHVNLDNDALGVGRLPKDSGLRSKSGVTGSDNDGQAT